MPHRSAVNARADGTPCPPPRKGSLPFEAAYVERSCGTRRQILPRLTGLVLPRLTGLVLPRLTGLLLLRLADVAFRIAVDGRDAGEVARLEGGEGNSEVMALLQPGETAEVGQALAFFLGHVIAVGEVRRGDGGEPVAAAGPVGGHLGDRVPDVIVVADGVQRLPLCPGAPARGQADSQQRGIE